MLGPLFALIFKKIQDQRPIITSRIQNLVKECPSEGPCTRNKPIRRALHKNNAKKKGLAQE